MTHLFLESSNHECIRLFYTDLTTEHFCALKIRFDVSLLSCRTKRFSDTRKMQNHKRLCSVSLFVTYSFVLTDS